MTRNRFAWLFSAFLFLFLSSCAPQPTKEVPKEYKTGQNLFHKICSNCHGSDAMGGHTKAPKLIDEEYLPQNFSDQEISDAVIDGTDKMPSQKNKATKSEIDEIIKYLRYSQKAAGIVVEDDSDDGDDDEDNSKDA